MPIFFHLCSKGQLPKYIYSVKKKCLRLESNKKCVHTKVPVAFVCGLSSPVVGLHSVGRLTSGRFCRVCLGTGDFLRPQGATPGLLLPSGGGGFIAWRLRHPKKGMPTGPKVFLALPDACGLRPCDQTHLKKRHCDIFVRWWDASINIRGSTSGLMAKGLDCSLEVCSNPNQSPCYDIKWHLMVRLHPRILNYCYSTAVLGTIWLCANKCSLE